MNLQEILKKHTLYLGGEEGGEKADLRGAGLRGADLQKADLQKADLRKAECIHTAGPMPTSGRMVYAVEHKPCLMVQAGCFWGTLDELEKAVREEHDNPHYHDVIAYFRSIEKRIYDK